DKIMCKIIFIYFFFINFSIPRRRKTYQIQLQHSINIISRHFLNHKFSHEQNPRFYGYWIVDLDVGVAVSLGVVLILDSDVNSDVVLNLGIAERLAVALISDFAKSLGVVLILDSDVNSDVVLNLGIAERLAVALISDFAKSLGVAFHPNIAVNLGVLLCPSVVVSLDVSALSSHSLDIFFHPIVAASFDAAVFHPNVAASFDPALVSPSILFPPLYGANSLAQFHEPTFQGHLEQE